MKLYMIRHGQTDMNTQHRMQGRTNTQLNERGREQAQAAAQFLRERGIVADRVIVSPLDRARETAEIVSEIPPSRQEIEARVIEMSFGEAEGKANEELPQGFYESFFRTVVDYQAPEGAESYEELFARIADFVEDLRRQYILDRVHREEETLFVVSHGAALHALLAYVGHVARADLWKLDVNNCSVFEIYLSDQKREKQGWGSKYQDSYEMLYEGYSYGQYGK